MRLYRFHESLALLVAFWRRRRISLSCSAPGSLPMQLLELVMIDTFWTLQSGAILAAHSSNRRKNMKLKMSALALLLALTAMLAPSTLAHTIEESCIPCDAVTSLEATELSTQLVNLVYDRTINLRVDIDHQDENGNTALILAAENNREDVVQLMLNSAEPYPNANAANNDGKTSLMWAAEHGNMLMIDYLLDNTFNNKASLDIKDNNDNVALDYVFEGNVDYYAVFNKLVDLGADISEMGHANADLLYRLHDNQVTFGAYYRELLEAKGVISNTELARTAMGNAAALDDVPIIEALLGANVLCTEFDSDDKYPADYALTGQHQAALDALQLQRCPDSRTPCLDANASHDNFSDTCKCNADYYANPDNADECLIQCEYGYVHNADKTACIIECFGNQIADESGEACVCKRGFDGVGEGVDKLCVASPAIWRAFVDNNVTLMAEILERVDNVNPLSDGNPPSVWSLHQLDSRPAMATLFANEPDSHYVSGTGATALHILSWWKRWNDPRTTYRSYRPFPWAITTDTNREQAWKFMKYLLEKHPEIEIDALWNEQTALMRAAYTSYRYRAESYISHAKVLIDAGADCSITRTQNGNIVSAWSYAKRARDAGKPALFNYMDAAATCVESSSGASGSAGAVGSAFSASEPSGPRDVSELSDEEWEEFLEDTRQESSDILQ